MDVFNGYGSNQNNYSSNCYWASVSSKLSLGSFVCYFILCLSFALDIEDLKILFKNPARGDLAGFFIF